VMVARADLPPALRLEGPLPIGRADIGPLNTLFSETFTERYRRDGLVGVRVPPLNPAIWQYAVADAGDGAMLWRDARGSIAAFNIAHRSGVEGWMGPLAVRDDCQGAGQGKNIVTAGIDLLKRSGCTVIGLETMPRTMDNIGFYSGLGFVPARLTVTLTVDAVTAPRAPRLLSSLRAASRDDAIRECAALVHGMLPGFDYTREIELTHELSLGDTLLLYDGDALAGFALCHSAPLVEGRTREELRVLKAVVRDEASFDQLLVQLADLARRSATARVAIRLQGDYSALYARLVSFGARVRWTDLRMALGGYEEYPPKFGIALSNWEI
jgi:GNAT superfamily N-acetyltransferase